MEILFYIIISIILILFVFVVVCFHFWTALIEEISLIVKMMLCAEVAVLNVHNVL